MKRFKEYFLIESKPFTAKREVNWTKIKVASGIFVTVLVGVLLFLPSVSEGKKDFHQKVEKGTLAATQPVESDPTQETIKQLQESQVSMKQVHGSLDHLYRPDTPTMNSGGRSGSTDRNSSMILTRGGSDTKSQLSAGIRIKVKLLEKVTVADQPMPVMGIVSKDVDAESGTAIPSGSKVLGDVTFDSENERASILWRSIILSDGRERPFSAVGIGKDGQVGVNGKIHSNGVKNVIGKTLTRFVGAYASGSMNTGAFGENQGGHVNGLRNAVSQTATDQANSMGEDLQKERKWIELNGGMETVAVLNQPFIFRDAGAMYGR